MSNWLEQIDQNIRQRRLFQEGQSILVAVSGGVDSMVLLHTLHRLAPRYQWKLAACHFDHQIRAESVSDASLVRKTAKHLKIPFTLGKGNVPELAKEAGISIEMAAREMRHDFLVQTAKSLGIPTLALAHHAGDQMELFFLRLFRGSGSEGLGGMKWVGPSPGDPEIQIVRPFLAQTKDDLLAFAKTEQIPFAEDATNASLDYARNRIRHELLPLLENHYQPALGKTVARVMDILSAEAAFTTETATQWLQSNPKSPFETLPLAIQRRCLQIQLLKITQSVDFEHLEQLRVHPQTPITLDNRLVVERDTNGLIRIKPSVNITFDNKEQRFTIQDQESGEAQLGTFHLQWLLAKKRGQEFEQSPGVEYFDGERIGKTVVLRYWRPGDRYQMIGAKTSVKLQNIFVNLKVPANQRRQRIVATTEEGNIFWVEGLRIAEFVKLTDTTHQRLQWTWCRKNAAG